MLLDALSRLAEESGHPELQNAPLLLWGMSAGGEFNYEFVAWKPERVIAFVVNKGGVYYSALLSREARAVPGLFFTGEDDLVFRTSIVKGLFAVNRRAGALWALVEEPGLGHAVGRSPEMSAIFFDDVLPMRLAGRGDPGTGGGLRGLENDQGLVGDLDSATYESAGVFEAGSSVPDEPTAWLPTERVARAWRAVLTGTPFEPLGS